MCCRLTSFLAEGNGGGLGGIRQEFSLTEGPSRGSLYPKGQQAGPERGDLRE